MELHLSKSKYCNAVQCPKMLWLKKNKPEEFDDSVMNQVILDNGSEVGDLAMGLFGEYVEVPFDTGSNSRDAFFVRWTNTNHFYYRELIP